MALYCFLNVNGHTNKVVVYTSNHGIKYQIRWVEGLGEEFLMRQRPTAQAVRLRLLALVLALALAWYAMNPAPGPARRVRRDEEQPDEKRREAKSPTPDYPHVRIEADGFRSSPNSLPSAAEGVDDLEWPDIIHVG